MSDGVSPGLGVGCRESSMRLGGAWWLCRGLVLGEVAAGSAARAAACGPTVSVPQRSRGESWQGLGSGLQPVPRAGPSRHRVRGHQKINSSGHLL